MKLQRVLEWCRGRDGKILRHSIKDAVRAECEVDTGYDYGAVEAAAASASQISEFLGNLVEMLHDNGVLADADVLKLLPGYEKAED